MTKAALFSKSKVALEKSRATVLGASYCWVSPWSAIRVTVTSMVS